MADNPINGGINDLDGNGIIGGHVFEDTNNFDTDKVAHPQKLDSTQTNPKELKNIDFKQDYTVLIRKKKYYAINQNNDELYIKIYQVNNFIDLTTSHRVNGGPAHLKLSIKGGERVIAANKAKVADTGWGSFEEIKQGWNNIDVQGKSDSTKWSQINGIDYNNMLKAREAKYYWKYAEKADWEPMDEIYVFSKSKVVRQGTNRDDQFKFVQIFFGYISSVTKSYGGQGTYTINIDAEDHLKLLRVSNVSLRPPFDMETGGVGVRYDSYGNMIIEDRPDEMVNFFQSLFAGAFPHEIIRQCAQAAGVPTKYLNTRIEEIKRVPFTPQINTGSVIELFNGNWQNRLQFCTEAANKLNLEFYADEGGNIVLKIPSYAVGINRLSGNYEGGLGTRVTVIDTNTSAAEDIMNQIKKGANNNNDSFEIKYTLQSGDSLQELARIFYGDSNRASEIWNMNVGNIKNPDTGIIETGEVLTIKIAKADIEQAVSGYKELKKREYWNDSQPLSTINNNSLSAKYDYLIRIIEPSEILSFSLMDSDNEIYTAAQVSVEYTLIDSSMKQVPPAVTRAVQDFDLIRQFGFRIAQPISTPICGSPEGAAIYAGMVILKSLSSRFTGSLTMIEEPSIRIGDPIRFHSYDEYPHTDMIDANALHQSDAQSVYYVESISRNIKPDGVSTMSLGLKAGRNYGQPSIYDNCKELYRGLYEEDGLDNLPLTNPANDPAQVSKAEQLQNDVKNTASQSYTIQEGDSLWKIAQQFYGNGEQWNLISDANNISKPNLIFPGQVLKIPSNGNSNTANFATTASSKATTGAQIKPGSHPVAEQYARNLGLTKTSGYRTAAESVEAGGYANDDHTKGIAEDFAGPVDKMDAFARWAAGSGLFTKVLWRGKDLITSTAVEGHFDHVHVSWRPQ